MHSKSLSLIHRTLLHVISSQTFGSVWVRTLKIISSSTVTHSKLGFTNYLQALVVSAQHRDDDILLQSVEEYILFRRDVGIHPTIFPYLFHLNIPDEALFHPVVIEMEYVIGDLAALDNVSLRTFCFSFTGVTCSVRNIAPYNKEQAVDDLRRNLVAICMRLFGLDITVPAMNWICQYHYEQQVKFLTPCKEIPSFGSEVDEALQEYIDLLEYMIRGKYCWQFEGGRYFGIWDSKVQEDGWVLLQPKVAGVRANCTRTK